LLIGLQAQKTTLEIKLVVKDVEKEEHSSIVGEIASWYNHSGNQSGRFSENWTKYYQKIQQCLSWT
jgi:phage-related protein